MNELVDTLLNIEVFAFIALLVWLYVKPSAVDRDDDADVAAPAGDDTALNDR